MLRLLSALIVLFATSCGGEGTDAGPGDHQATAPCPSPDTPILPDRWIETRRLALDESCALDSRRAAVRAMALAGPNANLVLPALEQLIADGPGVLRAEARATRRALLSHISNRRHPHDVE